jgi:hypothetical protein
LCCSPSPPGLYTIPRLLSFGLFGREWDAYGIFFQSDVDQAREDAVP